MESVRGPSYRGYRFPADIISHCVWLHHRFALSLRDIEELMLERGVEVTHETIRQWSIAFGPEYAAALRHRRPKVGDKWYLDEVFIKIQGEYRYLWRAVDADGNALDVLVHSKRDTAAARKFFKKLRKKTASAPRVVVTDKLRSYGSALRGLGMSSIDHRSHKGLNNRAENSHQPTRQRERAMKGFRSVAGAQRFLAAFSLISPHLRPRRHLMTVRDYRDEMKDRFTVWNEVTGVSAAV
ncbi:IS6 family transposase [Streptomyces sp. H27-H5]|uniref:IS6 family transposase n=1 Tax=Streptomyces sp. H27-H5 TaxID=2996460 RepID=UPI002271EE02|nr:IS6 family transposase [Streptomyces sp. H27-H5]MCY0962364.1 IS6 family transposase [Streptomyces sp. H27-H5]